MRYLGVMACDPRGVIGLRGKTPWQGKYPDELAHYYQTIGDQPLFLGYNTYRNMPEHALMNRILYVFSRVHREEKKNCPAYFVSSWTQFKGLQITKGCMIGGSQIAHLFLDQGAIDQMILTKMHRPYPGDCFFPLKKLNQWNEKILTKTPNYTVFLYENPSYSYSSHPSRGASF